MTWSFFPLENSSADLKLHERQEQQKEFKSESQEHKKKSLSEKQTLFVINDTIFLQLKNCFVDSESF